MSGRYPDHQVRCVVNLQSWRELTFLHYPYDPGVVQALVPPPLTVQAWDGVTWVGVTPFRMADVRVPALPPPPGWRAFPELNVRCYVRGPDGRDGIWFLGMAVPRLSFAAALRSIGLPYQLSESEVVAAGRSWRYAFGTPGWRRRPADGWFTARVQVGAPLEAAARSPLIESLTGRWNAYHRRGRVLWRTPVVHEPWPLHAASVTGDLTAPLRWVGLPNPHGGSLTHAAPAVHARLGPLRPA